MRYCLIPLFLLLLSLAPVKAQQPEEIPALKARLDSASGAAYAETLRDLGLAYYATDPDSGLFYSKRALVAGWHFNVDSLYEYAIPLGINLEMKSRYNTALSVYFNGMEQAIAGGQIFPGRTSSEKPQHAF